MRDVVILGSDGKCPYRFLAAYVNIIITSQVFLRIVDISIELQLYRGEGFDFECQCLLLSPYNTRQVFTANLRSGTLRQIAYRFLSLAVYVYVCVINNIKCVA